MEHKRGIGLNPEAYTVGQLLQTRYPLNVPAYQRSYAWDEEEINDFCTDIGELWERGGDGNHFFGGIVTVASEKTGIPLWSHTYEVVDGQQRLATFGMLISILASEFRYLANESSCDPDCSESAGAHAAALLELLTFRPVIDGKLQVVDRIRLSGVDETIYKGILKDPSTAPPITPNRESHRRLENARRQLLEFVRASSRDRQKSARERLDSLLALQDAISSKCTVIHIMSSNRREARRLFSVLNNRGRSLGAGDLLRATTLEFSEGSTEASARVGAAWDKILTASESKIDDFLMVVYASYNRRRPKKHLLFEEFQEAFYPEGQDPVYYAERTEMLFAELRLFDRLQTGEWPEFTRMPQVKDWDRSRLRYVTSTLDHSLAMPLLMAAATVLDEGAFAAIVHMVELVAFRYKIICNAHTTPLSNLYLRHGVKIRVDKGAYDPKNLAQDLQTLLAAHAPEQYFMDSLKAQLGYSKGKKTHVRYFFSVIESYYGCCANPSQTHRPDRTFHLNTDDLTIEHLYPQNPEVRDSTLDPVMNDLGNLTVLAPDDNTSLGNKLWSEKRSALAGSRLKLNRDLADFDQWTIAEFNAWQQKLLEYAVRAFRL